jgi:hypothetical protein
MNKSRIVGAVVCSALLALAASGHEPMTPDETINSFEDTFDVHPQTLLKNRTRICATGEFMGTPQASIELCDRHRCAVELRQLGVLQRFGHLLMGLLSPRSLQKR